MSQYKKVAIVGRPNVGKSALFNAIARKKIAIVAEEEGITRDRLYAIADYFGFPFEIIDTGGIDSKSKALFNKEIRWQAEIAIEEADSIILVVDNTTGPSDLDREVAKLLQKSKKPVVLAVNKVDNSSRFDNEALFATLGIQPIIPISALHNIHLAELLENALAPFDKAKATVTPASFPRIAIIGRANVGKSSLLNSLIDEERSIVSPIAGTTRDPIDTEIEVNGKRYILVDTAGIRRRKKEKESVDTFSFKRTERAIELADVCLVVLDAQQGITAEEKKIIRMVEDEKKGCILLFNKWDLVKGFRMEHCLKGIEQDIPSVAYYPKIFISATTKRNLDKLFPIINEVIDNLQKRISTGVLNKMLVAAMQKYHPPAIQGKRLRVYYMAQVDTKPPQFVLFVNSADLMVASYKRYLANELRETFAFSGAPIILSLRSKNSAFVKKRGLTKESSHIDRDLSSAIQVASEEEN